MTGTRTFTDSATQTIRFTGSTDTKMVLMDQSGNQTAQESMQSAAILGGAGPFTVDAVAASMQAWLQANGAATATVAVNAQGTLDIQLNSNNLYLGFRDETAVGDGSTLSDATIGFDGNGDGTVNETISGFSNFFGLNDFFIDTQGSNVKESDIVTTTFKTATSSTLTFNDETGVMTGSPLVIAANSSLQNIADAINANVTGVTASIVSEGSGSRLRISHNNSGALTVAQTAGTLLTDVGMGDSTLGLSQAIAVRSDIVNNPALVTRGALQWDANLGVAGEYFMSTGDGSIALAMAERFALSTNFSAAGDLGNVTLNFEEYGASILSRNSNKAATVERQFDHKDTLVSNLQAKSDTVRGVNLDEEMSNLILFERGYSASARVISVIQGMFDALENIIR
jgi:flagellar hook-associated protein 1 FlgK